MLGRVDSKESVGRAAVAGSKRELVFGRLAEAESQILLMECAAHKAALDGRVDRRVLGNQQHAGGVAVEPMREMQAWRGAIARGDEARQRGMQVALGVPRRRVDIDASWLIEREQVLVLIEDVLGRD